MGRATQVVFGDRVFQSKKDALHGIQDGLHGRSDDMQMMLHVLDSHPEARQKIGAGVKRIFVGVPPDPYKRLGKCFWVERTDGTLTDFSFLKCLSAPSARTYVLRACRQLVVPQILAFRNALPAVFRCPLRGVEVMREEAHIDHVVLFAYLVELFFGGRNRLEEAQVTHGADGASTVTLQDVHIANSWVMYHKEHAQLRGTSKLGNLTRPRSKGGILT